ncbi:hypothetical protein SASPL_145172 [Salvia splendens]|uniref:Uncharacterized protein n=1 Tax=Salvia splendens TaxID=180675 RepID=A0A8X8WGL1_SALSN|nr:hypothetical protein SASPL_145172 [Salvia splendens]
MSNFISPPIVGGAGGLTIVFWILKVNMSQAMALLSNVGGRGHDGDQDVPRQKFKKGDQTRGMWSHREEEILAASLVELVALGWKSDNSFRTGVGFSVNGDYKIDIDDKEWEHVVQVCEVHAQQVLAFLGDMEMHFPKDRATGAGAEAVADAANRVRSGVGVQSECGETESQAAYEEIPPTQHHDDEDDPVVDPYSSANSYEFDLGMARQAVYENLGDVEELTLAQRYKLCNILSDKPQRLEVFMGMPPQARLSYVLTLLEE